MTRFTHGLIAAAMIALGAGAADAHRALKSVSSYAAVLDVLPE